MMDQCSPNLSKIYFAYVTSAERGSNFDILSYSTLC